MQVLTSYHPYMPSLCVTLAKQMTLPLLYRHNIICCVQETGVKNHSYSQIVLSGSGLNYRNI